MKSNVSVLVNKFAIPAVLLVLGLFMLIVGIKNGQSAMFMLASFMMLTAGVLSILYSSGKLKAGLSFGIGGITGVAALVTLFFSFKHLGAVKLYEVVQLLQRSNFNTRELNTREVFQFCRHNFLRCGSHDLEIWNLVFSYVSYTFKYLLKLTIQAIDPSFSAR